MKYMGQPYNAAVKPLLILTPKEKILVDTGIGELPEKYQKLYNVKRTNQENLKAQLAQHDLRPEDIDIVVNTHCHSDHMGGNRAVQERFACRTTIPAGEAPLVDAWDEQALMLGFADQRADRFGYDDTLAAGERFRMGELDWQALAAPGHEHQIITLCRQAPRIRRSNPCGRARDQRQRS